MHNVIYHRAARRHPQIYRIHQEFRAPEEDLVFTRQDLAKLAKAILSGLQQRPGTNAGH